MSIVTKESELRSTSSQVRGLTGQADELTANELEHVWGGKPSAAPQDPPLPFLKVTMKEVLISGY